MKPIVGMAVAMAALFSPCVLAADQAEDVRSSQPASTAAASPDPQAAVKAVKLALESAGLARKNISVSSHASTVVLTGSVASEAEAAKVRSVAEKAAPGMRVSSRLEVPQAAAGTTPPASAQLVRDVEAALRNDPRTANLGITVSIDEQQTIGLHGLVPSAQSSAIARGIAIQTKGVNAVRNHMQTPEAQRQP